MRWPVAHATASAVRRSSPSFCHRMGDVLLDRVLLDVENPCDLAVGEAERDEFRCLRLAYRKSAGEPARQVPAQDLRQLSRDGTE
jgi:hypothetical protein